MSTVYYVTTFSDPFYTETVSLDGVDFALEFRWNERESVWYYSIGTPAGEWLAVGLKANVNTFPLLTYRNPRLPAGQLIVVSPSGDDSPPGLTDLGVNARCKLCYWWPN